MKNERKQAVALTYHQDKQEAPYLAAKGEGDIAEKIIRLAEEHDIPIQEDASLVSLLGQLDLFEAIPPDLYQAVAEVFAFVYQLDRSQADS
ncbi:MAG TPA: EscU/YscU/HrcU family type III secretion system export apparatus switch protein [Bacillales bacterium]|nr:EscU/YscU/HrcU family type III secretion system export apparatus switch protein [Bacillales bacterium]